MIDTVEFNRNSARGGKGGIGAVGGSLNNLFNSSTSAEQGTDGENADVGAAYVNGGNGGNGYNGAEGHTAQASIGGIGGSGGNGSDGSAITADTVKTTFDVTYDGYMSLNDGTVAGFYSALATAMGALSATAAGNPVTAALAAGFTTAATQFGSLATEAGTAKLTEDTAKAIADGAYLTAITVTNLKLGVAGNGGAGGNGGDGGQGGFGRGGGTGGQGGNGGNAYADSNAVGGVGGNGGVGGEGGFGAGGGRGGDGGKSGKDGNDATNDNSPGDSGDGGRHGFGAGDGSSGSGGNPLVGGNGGSGFGGSIFVRDGGSLIVKGNTTFSNGNVRGGGSDNRGEGGDAAGTDLFMMKGSTVILDAGQGNTITFNGTIADDSVASVDGMQHGDGDGAGLTIKSGTVVFNGQNTYSGQTTIEGGILRADDDNTLYANSNINFNRVLDAEPTLFTRDGYDTTSTGGVLQTATGYFDRFTGTDSHQVQWQGSGGFSAVEQDLEVSLNGGEQLTWGNDHFVGNGHALVLGSESATHKVTVSNNIDFSGMTARIQVAANKENTDHGIMSGVLSNGSLTVGNNEHTGVLILSANNTYEGDTHIQGGSVLLKNEGTLGNNSALILDADTIFDMSHVSDRLIRSLEGFGKVLLGDSLLTLNQNVSTLFAGSIEDGGDAGGTHGGIVKNGSGTLTLSGKNTYTGKTQLNSGNIILGGGVNSSLASDEINVEKETQLVINSGGLDGGLAANAALNNHGTVTLNANDNINAFTNSGTLNGNKTLTASTYALNNGSLINANLGSGYITANGAVQLNGTSQAETVNVASGVMNLGSAERLLDTSDVTVDGKLVLGGAEAIGSLAGINREGLVELSGSKLTFRQDKNTTFLGIIQDSHESQNGNVEKNGAGTLTLGGNHSYTGLTQINAGKIALGVNDQGSLASRVIHVSQGAQLDINAGGMAGGLAEDSQLTNSGTVTQNTDDTIGFLINSGTINGDKTLTATTYTLNDGSLINANLGTGTLTASGSVKLNGTSQASTVNVTSGVLQLGAAERLLNTSDVTTNGKLVLGGTETIGTLAGSSTGSVDLNGNQLVLQQDKNTQFSGVIEDNAQAAIGSVQKEGSATLTLDGHSTYTGQTQINAGKIVLGVGSHGSLASREISIAKNAQLDINAGGTTEGLAVNAVLNNNGVVTQNSDDTVAALINTGTLNGDRTLTATTYSLNNESLINANLGSGIVTANGAVQLNGTSKAQNVNVASGVMTLGSGERLLDTADLSVNGKLVLGGSETVGTLSGSTSGKVELGGHQLVLQQNSDTIFSGNIDDGGVFRSGVVRTGSLRKEGSGTLYLQGNSGYVGETLINAGKIVLGGNLASNIIKVAQDATLVNEQGGLGINTELINSGMIEQNADELIKKLVNSGTINGDKTLTAESYQLNNGSVVNANLGSGILDVNGRVRLNGTSQAENVRIFDNSMLSLGGEQRLSDQAAVQIDATGLLELDGGNQTIRTLDGNGTVNVKAYRINITSGGTFSGNIYANTTNFIVDGGVLNLSKGITTTQNTDVSSGSSLIVSERASLRNDITTVHQGGVLQVDSSDNLSYRVLTGTGTVTSTTGAFNNHKESLVKGFLTFGNDFTNQGLFTPGYSPGLITVNGNYTELGELQTELQSTSPISGYDQIRVGGVVNIGAGSALTVQSYSGWQPNRGDVYQIVADLQGGAKRVNGVFSTVAYDADGVAGPNLAQQNAAVVFDVATGQLLATGNNQPNSSFADMGSSYSQRAASLALMQVATADVGMNQIDSSTQTGRLAAQYIVANGTTAGENAERLVPQYYGAIADYAMATGGELLGVLLHQTPEVTEDKGSNIFSGYVDERFESADNADVKRNDVYLGGKTQLGSNVEIGAIFLQSNGDIGSKFGSSDVDGYAGSIFTRWSILPNLQLLSSLAYSKYDYDLSRTSVLGTAKGATKSDSYHVDMGIKYAIPISDGINIIPRAVLNYSNTNVNDLTEHGTEYSLRLSGYDASRTSLQLAAAFEWKPKEKSSPWTVSLDVGASGVLSEKKDDMNAAMIADERVRFPISFNEDNNIRAVYGLNAEYAVNDSLSVHAGLGNDSYRQNENGGKIGISYSF
ncbi:autotransporter-associated beta strand repeat-containing protein [Plesiomonas shigelloides]|uniref:autotransporter-associated beta strand repeat-containing protein n=1 Tax=Plesiomonas shigelloides TaxID=703 RepID=UPI0022456A2B|nr:autotransporter-associated beta strand repeat-containing protein [Plesiomonas shigelloides]MCX2534141.1 autotransporter-associated beta strand repeat-containing protein [Plesiomonas shigelloides]